MTVEVIVPFRGGCPHREAAWEWVEQRWRSLGWPVTEAPASPGPWIKAAAVTSAAVASIADVIVIADADVWTHGTHDAVQAVYGGTAWAVPHTTVWRLSQQTTAKVIACELGLEDVHVGDLAEKPHRAQAGGGVVVMRRDTYLSCPLDPRFVGWGQEDEAYELAMTVLHGPVWRGPATLRHLYHPPQKRRSRGVGNDANLELFKRYKVAARNPGRMRALVDEAKAVSV